MGMLDLDDYARRVRDAGLGHRLEALLAAVRPSVRLEPQPSDPDADVGRSHLWGCPDLPSDVPWPTHPDGRPLVFIAQINLAEMPLEVVDGVLPTDGWLHLFYDVEEQPWGFDPADRGGWALLYTPAGTTLTPRQPPGGNDSGIGERPVTLGARVEQTVVPPFTVDADRILTEQENHRYADALEDHVEAAWDERIHRLLGHPDLIQGDIQLESQLAAHGIYVGGADHLADPRATALAAGAADWRVLLQVDSDDDNGVYFGDSGRIYLMIREQDLAAARWDDTWLVLQCY